jgi:hypothetical protein
MAVLIGAMIFFWRFVAERWPAPQQYLGMLNVQLRIWTIPLIIAFIAAWKISRWVESDIAGWIASGLASAAILHAALSTAYELGWRHGKRTSRTESKDA